MKSSKQLELKAVKKVRTSATYKPGKGTKIMGQSETIQNDTLTVSQLLLKHINGGEVRAKEGQYYDEEPDHDDPDVQQFGQMDLAERQDVLEGVRSMTQRLQKLEKEWIEEEKLRKENADKALKKASEGQG